MKPHRARLLVVLVTLSCRATPADDGGCRPPTCASDAGICGSNDVMTASGCVLGGVTMCSAGFIADGGGGCRAALPNDPCSDGMIAPPGESACRAVADCGSDPYGVGPFDAATVYVDAATIAGGDGSRARPFRVIGDAAAVAPKGATIAIAAGAYLETLDLTRPVTLAGRCPTRVSIKSTASSTRATIHVGSDVTVRGVSVTGAGVGISSHEGERVLLDRVWVHDTGNYGVYATSAGAPASMTMRDSLIERATATGLNVSSAEVTLERSVVRTTHARASDRATGYGVAAKHFRGTALLAKPAKVTVLRSLIEQNDTLNVVGSASEVTIDSSVVRDARPRPLDGTLGACVQVQDEPDTVVLGALRIVGSEISGCSETGLIVVGTHAEVEATTLHDIHARTRDRLFGIGISAQIDVDTRRPATVEIRRSLVANTHYAAVLSVGSVVTVESSLIRGTAAEPATGLFGDGIALAAWSDGTDVFDGPVTVVSTRVSESARAGIALFGARLSIRAVRLACNAFDLDVERAYNAPVSGAGFAERDFTLDDQGGNLCGCDGATACRAQSAALRPVARTTAP